MWGTIASLFDGGQLTPGDVVLAVAALVVGGVAWRSKRGDFYKAVADEKSAENVELRRERDEMQARVDVRPIVEALERVMRALETHARTNADVVAKVGEMNGSLRALTTAMDALAKRLITEEAARALLAEAGRDREPARMRGSS
jgi:ABC-type anion transport system duplicated permease subunit